MQRLLLAYQVNFKVESYSSRQTTELRYYLKGKTVNNKMNSCLKIRRWNTKGDSSQKKQKRLEGSWNQDRDTNELSSNNKLLKKEEEQYTQENLVVESMISKCYCQKENIIS